MIKILLEIWAALSIFSGMMITIFMAIKIIAYLSH